LQGAALADGGEEKLEGWDFTLAFGPAVLFGQLLSPVGLDKLGEAVQKSIKVHHLAILPER
jgi:hypothetical protein